MRFSLVFLGVLAITPIAAFAAPYVPLEPLPFVKATSGALSFADLLNGFFQLSLVLGAAITAVMLTVGGVQYMTSDAAGGKQQGKDRIRNAALGFLLLLSVYVIIKTINPDLLVFDLSRITDVGCRQGQCVAKNTAIGGGTRVPDSSTQPGGRCDPAQFGGVLPRECADSTWVQARTSDGRAIQVVFQSGVNAQTLATFRRECAAASGIEERTGVGTNITFTCKTKAR